uniref:Uncharacterized protein n=1 Tax=Oryza rufipogon TaxID=4529 RepID=A0A0E0MZV9_ORYRU
MRSGRLHAPTPGGGRLAAASAAAAAGGTTEARVYFSSFPFKCYHGFWIWKLRLVHVHLAILVLARLLMQLLIYQEKARASNILILVVVDR